MDNKKRKLDENNKNNIQIYFKEKEKKKLLKENEEENANNKNKIIENNDKGNFSSPKSIHMRNIPEEDRRAMETMFNEDEFSDEEQDII